MDVMHKREAAAAVFRPSLMGKFLRLATMLAALAVLTGCNKMLANFSLNQADKRVKEAQEHNAEQFAPEALQSTLQAINETQQNINAQNFKEARLKGKEAATLAKELVETVKSRRANHLKSEVNKWIDIMDMNEGQSEDPIRYDQILATNNEALKAWEEKDWDQAIELFLKARQDIDYVLANLKRRAEEGLQEVDKLKQDLIEEGAPEHFPEAIVTIDNFREQMETLITEKHDYRTALLTLDQAKQAAADGILKTKEVKADKLLRQIETLLATAESLGAPIYAPRTRENVTREFEELLKQFFEQNYDTVLTSGPDLIPKAEELIVETKRESARTKIEAVREAIERLIDGQTRTYLPGRVERMEQMLANAQERFDAAAYTDAEKIALEGLEEERKIIDEFDTLASNEITDASARLTIAENVFSTMESIFEIESPVPPDSADMRFEEMKSSLRKELEAKLNSARLQLGTATLKRENQKFNEAIEIAKDVVTESEEVVRETYHVVAHNAIMELNNQLTVLEREGGRDYAAAEVDRTQELVAQASRQVEQGEYRTAVETAAQAKTQLEIAFQELARVAVKGIESARSSLEKARELGGKTYQEDKLRQLEVMLAESRELLEANSLKESIKMAERAETIAQETAEQSIRQWAEDELRRADIMLERARKAGADVYAPEIFDQALNERRNAQGLFDSGNYVEAQSTATEAAETAHDALFALVHQAEDAIASAKRYEGWTYEPEKLAQAGINLRYAREFMEQGNYKSAHNHARAARATADEVSLTARNAAFRDRLDTLQARVNAAQEKGPGYYQIGDLSRIIGEIQRLEKQYTPEEFQNAAERIELLEARLEGLFESTPDVLEELVENINEELGALEERGARAHAPDLAAQASKKVNFAQLDFRDERYRNSYANIKDAVTLMQEIELRLNERDFDRRLNELFTEFSSVLQDFGPVLNMGAPVLMRMTTGPNARSQALSILNASNPSELRQRINDLAAQLSLLEPPETRIEVYNAAQAMFEEAKQGAGGFEKLLILDQYSLEDARNIIQQAFMQMRSARNQQQNIQTMLESTRTPADQQGVQRALQLRP